MTGSTPTRHPPWWDAERGDYRPDVEHVARMIDPEAFGLPSWKAKDGSDYLTDRDEARDKAVTIIGIVRGMQHD